MGDEISEEKKKTLEKIHHHRDWARQVGLFKAADALDQFLYATGEYQEIPPDQVVSTREEFEDSHKERFLANVKNRHGARTMIAFLALTKPNRKARPEDEWPAKVKFKMSFLSGKVMPGMNEDGQIYCSSQIKSEMVIECNKSNVPRTYICKITKWRGWIVDNYDWEGDKQFGGSNAFFKWLFPCQSDMNNVQLDGLGAPYSRSSRSFDIPHSVADWQEKYDSDDEVEQDADYRRAKIQFTKDEDEARLRSGLQRLPGPAEEILESMRM